MAVTQDVFVINEGFEERRRTTGNGTKSRYTFSIKSEPIFVNLDPFALGAGPAAAIRDEISNGIKNISEVASPATLLKRKYAANAMEKGSRWAMKRYGGGRTGPTPPNQSDRLFNDSGRLAGGVFVRQNTQEKSWTVNVPANRLDPSTFKNQASFVGMVERLRSLVPALRDPFTPKVDEAIRVAVTEVLHRKGVASTKREGQLTIEMLRQVAEILRQIDELARSGG